MSHRNLKSKIQLILCLALLPHVLSGKISSNYVQPEVDGRSYFTVNMGNALEEHSRLRGKERNFIISPAAVQKSLAILYNSVEENANDLLDVMLLEMGLKYFDAARLMEMALRDMTSFEVLKEERLEKLDQPIERVDVLRYFERDFVELQGKLQYENFISTPRELKIKENFKSFAKEFFNVTILPENDEKLGEILKEFGVVDSNPRPRQETIRPNLDIFNKLSMEVNWGPIFKEKNGYLHLRDNFLFGEIFNTENKHMSVQVLELPLESSLCPLSMLIILPRHSEDLYWSTNYEIIRDLTDIESISKHLHEHLVDVRLPKVFDFVSKFDIINHLRNNSLTSAKIYEGAQLFKNLFVELSKPGVKLSHFWQFVKLKINAKVVDESTAERHVGFFHGIKEKFLDLTKTATFDATNKPFTFIIKSEHVVYFMGHYYGE